MSSSVVLDRAELMNQLSAQASFLQASASSYDSGFKDEAKRMAVSLRILFFTNSKNKKVKNKSLLDQLDGLNKLYYLSTATPYSESNLLTHAGLLHISISSDSGGTLYAPLAKDSSFRKWRLFSDWWNEIVIKDKRGTTYTREELILTTADKDGGAHVDPTISDAFASLKSGEGIGWENYRNGKSYPIEINVAYESIRQITYEALCTLHNKYPELYITQF